MSSPAISKSDSTRESDARRYAREARRVHGTDAWLMELLAPLHSVRLGRVSVGDAAEVATFCIRHLREDRAPQIASALAFRTLFGLLPVLVVVTLIAKSALGGEFLPATQGFFETLGLDSVKVQIPGAEGDAATSIGLDAWLMQLVSYANTLNITALGWTGFILVALSAIWVLVTIEEAFNVIYRSETGRSWVRRILVYWFILTVGPLLLGLTPVLLRRLDLLASIFEGWTFVAWVLRGAASLLLLWLALLIAYLTIPAARVSMRPAVIGAFVGAVLLQIGKATFGLYLEKAFGVSALYGSLGLIPLFMFWVYLMWLVILFGAEIAALLQAFRGRSLAEDTHAEPDAASLLRALALVAERFRGGRTATMAEVAGAGRMPLVNATRCVDALEDAGYVRRLERPHGISDTRSDEPNDGITLARPAGSIPIRDVLLTAWRLADRQGNPAPLERKLREAQLSAIADTTLDESQDGADGSP